MRSPHARLTKLEASVPQNTAPWLRLIFGEVDRDAAERQAAELNAGGVNVILRIIVSPRTRSPALA
jgi:hypothetical protein